MDRFLLLRLSANFRKYAVSCLACSWILGLIFGIVTVQYADFNFSGFYDSFHCYTSFSILSVALIPVLVSILVVFIEQAWLLFVISFLKAFSFAYVSYLLTVVYGSAGWLIQLLMMFSDCVSLPFLWWFWCRLLKSTHKLSFSTIFPVALAAIAIGTLDFKVISPFWSTFQILQKG